MPRVEHSAIAERISRLAQRAGASIAVAESLTSGGIAAALGKAPRASDWFMGGVVAYARSAKHELLNVSDGPVVRASAAEEMAEGVRTLMHADVSAAVTGAGGPEPQDGQPDGTVFLAIATSAGTRVTKLVLKGDPGAVVHETVTEALLALERALEGNARV